MRELMNCPCPNCDRDRMVFPCQLIAARTRQCSRCTKYTRQNEARRNARHPVECPNCGQPRALVGRDAERAATDGRWCHPCANAAVRESLAEAQAYVDEMAVERLLAGMPVNSTRAERQAAVAALTARRLTIAVIAERLRVTPRTVERLRARERVAA